jgi:hypothetical protein
MKGVVIIPNVETACAVIQRSDDFLMVVEPVGGAKLALMDSIEFSDMKVDRRMLCKNLTTEERLEVIVQRVDSDLSWEEKMSLSGKRSK